MLAFNCVYYVYFKHNEEVTKFHHKVYILNQESYLTITPPLKVRKEENYHFQHICKTNA